MNCPSYRTSQKIGAGKMAVARPKLVPMLPKERADAVRLLAALMLAARPSPTGREQVEKWIRGKHRNTDKELLPPKETDQYPARYPASYGARHDAQPSLRGVETDERAGDKG